MQAIRCQKCRFNNPLSVRFCDNCKDYLLLQATEKSLPSVSLYIPTFQAGIFGILLLDQEQHKDEIFTATRWLCIFVPLLPLTRITFKVEKIKTIASQMDVFTLRVFESRLPGLMEVLWVYLRLAIATIPILVVVKYGDLIKANLGVLGVFVLMIGSILGLVFMMIRMQNDKIDYEKHLS